MNFLEKKISKLFLFTCLLFVSISFGQNGEITINQDNDLPKLLALKKEVNSDDNESGKYRIQIFSGDRKTAEKQKTTFERKLFSWKATQVFETPNYKVWIGKFRTRLEADRALIAIKEYFPSAFIFKPKSNKK